VWTLFAFKRAVGPLYITQKRTPVVPKQGKSGKKPVFIPKTGAETGI
jgi:hypothetical protein